jgi:hypothetical protein
MPESWRGTVNSVLYKVQFEKNLGDPEVIDWLAADLIERPLAGSDAGQDIADLTAALRSEASLTEGGIPQPHGERAVRDFLTKVVARMNDLR